MKRHQIINSLIERNEFKTYLEIGLDEGNFQNDEKIRCQSKESVDPMEGSRATHNVTSDEFFATNTKKFDLIFIDGLHHSDQVIRDIDNALNSLTENGIIVVHDCNPTTEAMQKVPRIQGEWTGDVWRAFCSFRIRPDLFMCVIDTDYGCGIITRGYQKPLYINPNVSWNDFVINRKGYLNLIPSAHFETINTRIFYSRRSDSSAISVCIPTFEQYGFGIPHLTALLDSLLNQKAKFEVVISDNSKDENIYNLATNYSALDIRYFKNETIGISHNTNNAIDKARYEKIKPMYMDDVLVKDDALQKFSEALDESPWAVCDTHRMTGNGQLTTVKKAYWRDEIIKGTNTIGMPSCVGFRRTPHRFDPNLKTLLDCEFYWLLKEEYGEPKYIGKPLIGGRYHSNSTSHKQGDFTKKEYEYLREKHPKIKSIFVS